MHIFLVEDTISISRHLAKILRDRGHTVDTCHNGLEASVSIRNSDYDIIILDLDLPLRSGFEILEDIAKYHISSKVIVMSSYQDASFVVKSFHLGAKDYIRKPFNIEEFVVRIDSLLKKELYTNTNTFESKGYTLYPLERRLYFGEKSIHLTKYQTQILEVLFEHKGKYVPSKKLLRSVWGNYMDEKPSNSINVHLHYLRKHMQALNGPELIETRKSFGYIIY